jgi:hypothetical protein
MRYATCEMKIEQRLLRWENPSISPSPRGADLEDFPDREPGQTDHLRWRSRNGNYLFLVSLSECGNEFGLETHYQQTTMSHDSE